MQIDEIERILVTDALSPDDHVSANAVALDISERRGYLVDIDRKLVGLVLASWLTRSRSNIKSMLNDNQLNALRAVAIGLAVNWRMFELRPVFQQILSAESSDLMPGDRACIVELLEWFHE